MFIGPRLIHDHMPQNHLAEINFAIELCSMGSVVLNKILATTTKKNPFRFPLVCAGSFLQSCCCDAVWLDFKSNSALKLLIQSSFVRLMI